MAFDGQLTPEEQAKVQRLRDDFEFFSRNCLFIRTKTGEVKPFHLNRAQKHLHQRLEAQRKKTGKVRAIILKGRQLGACYTPDMRVLTADYRWTTIDDVRVGERLIGIDENPVGLTKSGRNETRRMRPSVVEAKVEFVKDVFAVTLDNGTVLKVTGDHRHLCQQRGGCLAVWRSVEKMKVGDKIRAATRAPTDHGDAFENGWAGGLLDGEGSFGATPELRLCLSQVEGPVLQRFRDYLRPLGINYYEQVDNRKAGTSSKLGNKPVHTIRVDCFTDIVEVLVRSRPTRFVGRELFAGKKLSNSTARFNAWATVVSIEPIGKRRVIDLQTSEKTYVCEGLVSHNSTYIQGRFYWRLWGGRGLEAFILTHEQPATDNMFAMAQRFHDNAPVFVKPKTKAANAKELAFADNDCSYSVATAGTKGVGRSSTLQLFHGSEVGFWPNAETHIDGAFQAIADVAGTERMLESTANGIGNVFQRRYSAAQRGDGDEEAIFIPWYWGEDYIKPVPEGHVYPSQRDAEHVGWIEYGRNNALEPEQLYWAFCKNRDMASAIGESDDTPCWKFMQEYPASADEAFQTAGNSFIPSPAVAVARKNRIVPVGAMVIGLDPARGGGDKTGVVDRVGRVMGSFICERWDDRDLMVVAGKASSLLRKFPSSIMNIDVGGLGAGVYDRLAEMGFSHRVNAVNFGSGPLGIGPTGDELYANRRAEMWDCKRAWYMDPAGVQVPDDDVFHADETSAVWGPGATRNSSNNELTLEPKDKIRERLGFSPDLGDAAALTFAVPVGYYREEEERSAPARGQSSVTGY